MTDNLEVMKRYYTCGKKKSEHSYIRDSGLAHGTHTGWYENGRRDYIVNYADGVFHGLYISWHQSGYPLNRGTYCMGKLHGLCERWNEYGDMDEVTYFLYHKRVTEEEYRKHILIEEMAGLENV